MSIYSLYEDTYKRLNNKITLSNFLSNNEIKKLNSIFDVCKSIDKNIVLLSLAKSNIDDMDKLRFEAYEQLRSYINCIFDSTEFRTELNDQLANYNINDNNSLYIYMYQRSIKPFTLKSAHAVIAEFTSNEMYNILNIPVSTLTNIIYKTFYQNKDIMDVFDNFKNITNAGIDLWSNDCKIYPNINNEDINISIDYYKIFKEEE